MLRLTISGDKEAEGYRHQYDLLGYLGERRLGDKVMQPMHVNEDKAHQEGQEDTWEKEDTQLSNNYG